MWYMAVYEESPREGVLKLLNGEQPKQVPWFGDLAYYATMLTQTKQRPADFHATKEYIEWHRDLGVGFYLQAFFPFRTEFKGCEVKEWDDGLDHFTEIITPKGKLRQCWRKIPEAFTIGPTEHFIKSVDDLPAYNYWFENTEYIPDNTFADARREHIEEMGILMTYMPKSPIMQLIALDAGMMPVMDIFMKDKDALDDTCKIIAESHGRGCEIVLNCPADAVMIPENLSAEMAGPMLFEDYMRDYQTKWAAKIKEAGMFSCIHMDGTLKGLLREECTVGLTFIEAMTPAPVGDLTVKDWEDFTKEDETIYWGGLPGAFFSPQTPEDVFVNHIIETLEIMKTKPRFVLGAADQVPPDSFESRIRMVRDIVNEHGNY